LELGAVIRPDHLDRDGSLSRWLLAILQTAGGYSSVSRGRHPAKALRASSREIRHAGLHRDMTAKLVVLYTQPADAAAFDEHYLGVHGPLVDKIPGLLRWEGARIVAAPDGGEQTYFRVAELYFSDPAALQAALGSEQGQATAADFQAIAPSGSRMFVAAVDD
jgi:uncharacterized protein (TIGR02118 family)